MITFKQFLLEREERNFKGWMSPKGTPMDLEGTDEHHGDYWHPEAKKTNWNEKEYSNPAEHRINSQLKQGFARYSKYRDSYNIHYDETSPGGKKAALHTLNHFNLRHNDKISIFPEVDDLIGKSEYLKLGDARKYLKEDFLNESILDPNNSFQKTLDHFHYKKNSSDASERAYWRSGEMVPIHELEPYLEYDRSKQEKYPGHFDDLRSKVSKNGITDMGILYYNHKTNKAYLGEGNTRLAVAKSLGYTHVPVRAYRHGHENKAGKTVKKPYTTDPNLHVPADIKPSELGFSKL